MKKVKTDHMKYKPNMEIVDSSIMDTVLYMVDSYDYKRFSKEEVKEALTKDNLTIEDFGALLSPAAFPFLEQMAQKAKNETQKHFGNSVSVFTPLYIANYCENYCVYCGFNCHNKIDYGGNRERIKKYFCNRTSRYIVAYRRITANVRCKIYWRSSKVGCKLF